MPETTQLFPDLSYSLEEVERDSAGTPRSLALALVLGGVLGAVGNVSGLPRRQIAFAGTGSVGCAALGLLAFRSPVPWVLAARRRPGEFAVASWALAIGSTAFGGGHRSPAYFPAVLLTAVGGGGLSDARGSLPPGIAVAAGHFAGCLASRRGSGTLTPRGMSVSAGHSAAFPVASVLGGLAGRLAGRGRILSDSIARESRADETGASKLEIDKVVRKIPSLSAEVLKVLTKIAAEYSNRPEVGAATREMETALATLDGAMLRLELEDEVEPLDSWRRLRAQVEAYNLRPGNVRTRVSFHLEENQAVGAAVVGALMDCVAALVQNAANAGANRDEPVHVAISVWRRTGHARRWARDPEDRVVMQVEDNAGATRVPDESTWGGGLRRSARQADLLGGALVPAVGKRGLRMTVELPWQASHARATTRSLTFARQYADDVDGGLRDLRWVTFAQALLFTAGRRGFRPWQLVLPVSLWCAGELTDRLLDGRKRDLAQAGLGVWGMCMFPGAERPPAGGYAGLLTTQIVARGSIALAVVTAILQTAGALVVAGPRRFESDGDGAVADRVFALVCAGGGIGERLGYEAIRSQEEQLGGEAWRRRMLLALALPGRDEHHFVKPLETALGIGWDAFQDSDIGEEYRAARVNLTSAQTRLEQLMRRGDPLLGLQDQLARMFAPAPVKVHGQRAAVIVPTVDRELLDAVAYRIALVGLGQQIAEKVRRCLPTDWWGRGGLRELRLEVMPEEDGTHISVRQIPFQEGREDGADAALDAAARLAGGSAEISSDSFRVAIDSRAFS